LIKSNAVHASRNTSTGEWQPRRQPAVEEQRQGPMSSPMMMDVARCHPDGMVMAVVMRWKESQQVCQEHAFGEKRM
jgi:hypothetical protein